METYRPLELGEGEGGFSAVSGMCLLVCNSARSADARTHARRRSGRVERHIYEERVTERGDVSLLLRLWGVMGGVGTPG